MSTPVARLAVLGAGTMGQGIAQLAAQSGIETRLYDVVPAQLDKAFAAIGAVLEKLVQKGKLGTDARSATLGRLTTTLDLAAACGSVDLVIEAAPEDLALKAELLSKATPALSPTALIGSNTSSLSVTELGRRIGEPARCIGLHFFNPPPVMPLLEIVRGRATSDESVARALGFAAQIGKEPIVVKDFPGFASSRLGVALGAEAMRMLEDGVASAADIDRAMEFGYRHPMGPLKLTDLVGLDVRLAILEHLEREIGAQFKPPEILRKMVKEGRLGKKVGMGFYRWTEAGPEAVK